MRLLLAALFVCAAVPAFAADNPVLDKQFHDTVQPFVGKYCAGCHSGKTPAGGLDFKSFDSLDEVTAEFARWSLAADRLANKEMPPKPMAPPPQQLADQIVAWVHSVKADELRRHAGDPGVVLARRLSNAEYNDTIRDLTGQDIQPAKQFPVDPANTAGFDNSGETLTMSPALLNKYLQAARGVADTMVLNAEGIEFAPHPMQAETDREKYVIQRIIAFYNNAPTDYAKYFEAAWRYRYRAQLGTPKAMLAATAASMKISAKYLPLVWGILHDKDAIGPVAKLQAMWNGLPAPAAGVDVQPQTLAMRDFVSRIRADTAMQFAAPIVRGLPGQSQPLHNWRLEEYAQNHSKSDPAALRADTDPAPKIIDVPKFPGLHADATPRWLVIVNNSRASDADLVYPAGQTDKYQKSFARLASVFPDNFYISERGRYWPDNSEDKGRLLSAGYHNSGGYYRDDTALVQLILDANGRKELDRLWNEFDFAASQTANTWTQFYFNQSGEVNGKGAEGGSPRPVGHAVTDSAVIQEMRDKYLALAAADPRNDPVAPAAIRWHFNLIDATLRRVEKERVAAEPRHLAALADFAARAWRRPLLPAERANILSYYRTLRDKNQLSHEDAIRDCLVDILMSPDFLYRFDLGSGKVASAKSDRAFAAQPLSGVSLANRLSYFLWSSMPDAGLLRHAQAGDLGNPKVLLAETRRMLKDDKVKGLATEFTGNWLGFRLFETNNSVDRERFPAFNDDLREAMFQEPVRFMQDTISNDRPVLDLVYGDYTFVNPALAAHYGMPTVSGGNDNWVRVDNAARYNRGGLLPMAVFLTQNSPGLRTSPVKRGAWLVEKVLGIRIPPPPPVVPELPSDEAKMDLPVRDALAQHRANPVCASCHAKFDPLGLAFEGFGPVGNARKTDLAGRPVDTSFTYFGAQGDGIAGLKEFIKASRQDAFTDNLSRKLLAFALGRSLQLSDEALIDQMKANLAKNNFRFRALVETIVLSPQFRDRRAPIVTASASTPAAPAASLHKIDFQKGAR